MSFSCINKDCRSEDVGIEPCATTEQAAQLHSALAERDHELYWEVAADMAADKATPLEVHDE